jgi:hypothetical protein
MSKTLSDLANVKQAIALDRAVMMKLIKAKRTHDLLTLSAADDATAGGAYEAATAAATTTAAAVTAREVAADTPALGVRAEAAVPPSRRSCNS